MTENDLATLLPKKFVQRRDVKAVQDSNGAYRPVRERDENGELKTIPWKMGDFRHHLAGTQTFGHYMCDAESKTKLFVFDIDLEKVGTWVQRPDLSELPDDAFNGPDTDTWIDATTIIHKSTPRQDWLDYRHPGRSWYKLGLRTMAEMLSSAVSKELDIPVACAYSGNKGVHVYGFTGTIDSATARAGALMAMEAAGDSLSASGEFVPTKGRHFFKYNSEDPVLGLNNLSIELYPKQDQMDDKEFGNLVRLPLGKNRKNPKDPTFFLDQCAPFDKLAPHPDPVALLNGKSPWEN